MDQIILAVDRLWGSVGKEGRLHPSPRFADELADHFNGNLDVRSLKVSRWSFGEQLEHLFLTSHYVLDRLEESMTGQNTSERMGVWGAGLMVGGFIPRYVFPTIPQLVPRSGTAEHLQPLQDTLKKRLEDMQWSLVQIRACHGKSRHPRMKYLTAGQWMYFWDVHHRHHLAIMRDIRKAAR